MTEYKLVVMSSPVEGREAEYNDWYDNQHLGDVVRLPGFTGAKRFELQPGQEAPLGHTYLAIYDMETDDVDATMAGLVAAASTPAMPISDALAMPTVTLIYRARD